MKLVDSVTRHPDRAIALVLAVLGALIFLPHLGSFPLWDPWETQYTQVAWEMANHGTWVEPHYRGLANWWSKPVFCLWLLRAGLFALWDPLHGFFKPELAARLPFALIAVLGGVLQYDWVRRLYGRATGFVAACILLTAPQFVLAGRQVMTDVPFVVATSASLGYLAVGLFGANPSQSTGASPRSVLGAWIRARWPFLLFWSFQAVAILAKGFAAPVIAIGVIGIHVIWSYPGSARRSAPHADSAPTGGIRLGPGLVVILATAVTVMICQRMVGYSADQKAMIAAASVLLGLLVLLVWPLRATTFGRHVRAMAKEIGLGWGLLWVGLLAGPWFAYMTLSHGWAYWENFIFYHHLGRAAGGISKPGGTFDFLVRHLGFGMFPWSAWLLLGLGRWVLGQPRDDRNADSQVFVLAMAAVPFALFAVSATKLAHYGLPVVPAAALLIARSLTELFSPQPGLRTKLDRGVILFLCGLLALTSFAVLAHDVLGDYRTLLRTVVYYYNHPTPTEFQPRVAWLVILLPVVLSLCSILLTRRPHPIHPLAWLVSAVALGCHLGWVSMPAMGATYTYQPLVEAYQKETRGQAPLGQFNSWPMPERSVLFFSKNRAAHLKDEATTRRFLAAKGRKFVIVDKNRLADLQRIAESMRHPLFTISTNHPYARLMSDAPSTAAVARVERHLLSALPEGTKRIDARFANSIRWIGYKVAPQPVIRGAAVEVRYYFEVDTPIALDWNVFVHAEGLRSSTRRLQADHPPMEGLYPTSRWKPGQIVEDVFRIHIPKDYPEGFFFLWTGFYRQDQRLSVVLADDLDRSGRIRGPFVRVRREGRNPETKR